MEMKHSKEFVTLAKNGNFLKTAEDLFMAQSTLSKHIQFLERDCGHKLFYRNTRKVELTPFGKAYLPYAEEIVRIEEKCESELFHSWDAQSAQIHLGLSHGLSAYDVPMVVNEFRREHGSYNIDILSANSETLIDMLVNRACDFVIIREPYSTIKQNQWKDFNIVPFCKDSLVLVVPASHPLAGQRSVAFDQLRDESFISLPEGTAIHKRYIDECRRHFFEPHIAKIIPSSSAIFDAICAGCGVALYGKKRMSAVPSKALKILDIEPTIYIGIYIVSYKKHTMSYSSKLLMDYFQLKASTD